MKTKAALPTEPEIPFIKDQGHIYNNLVDLGIEGIDAGWKYFTFELHSNIQYNNKECNGLTEFDNNRILLEISLKDQLAREIIIHEFIHVMLETLAMDEGNFPNGVMQITNEQLTWGLTRMHMLFKKLNPKFYTLMFG